MAIFYKYDSISNIVHVYPEGELSISEIGKHFKEITLDNSIQNGLIEIVYLGKVTNFLFSSTEASLIPGLYKDFKEKKNIKATILIGNNDLQYGIGRMVQNLFEANNLNDEVFVVHNIDEALNLANEISNN